MKKAIWILIVIAVISTAIYFIFIKKPVVTTPEVVNNDTQTQKEEETTKPTEETTSNDTPSTDTSTLTGFTTESKNVGSASESKYVIDGVEQTAMVGYHKFVFTLSSTDGVAPFVNAEYVSSAGVLRLTFNGITDDNSGIGYQKEISINKDGIIRLYHNISGTSEIERYDIGVSKAPEFKIEATNVDKTHQVIISVKYPGATTSSIDLGSENFSTEKQEISGVGSAEKASIAKYSYSSSAGVVKFVWTVSSTNENPIPSVIAEYDMEGVLNVTFSSLSMDKAVNAVAGIDIPGNMAVNTGRTGESSIYEFHGITTKKEFKLSATTSPNQVILEIKL